MPLKRNGCHMQDLKAIMKQTPEKLPNMPGEHKPLKAEKKFTFPSPIVPVKIQGRRTSHTIHVPQNELFRTTNIFEEHEYSIPGIRRHNGPIKIFDIGANIGLYAIYMKFVVPNSVIYCFEPSGSSLVLLEVNVRNLTGIHLCPYGLYNKEQEAKMNMHRFNTGENSIKFKNKHYTDSVRVLLKDAGAEFDKLKLTHLDVLKIDTEGCEVEILESFGNRLSLIDYILLEYHSEKDRRQIDHFLSDFYVFESKSEHINRGTVKYINSFLLDKMQLSHNSEVS